jgi:hypothetical protein
MVGVITNHQTSLFPMVGVITNHQIPYGWCYHQPSNSLWLGFPMVDVITNHQHIIISPTIFLWLVLSPTIITNHHQLS